MRRSRPEPRPRFVRKLNQVGSSQRVGKVLGSLTLLKAMAEEMNVRAIIDARIPWKGPADSLTHGEVVEALILNRLVWKPACSGCSPGPTPAIAAV